MEDVDFIIETVFGNEPETERKNYRETMLANGNRLWIRDFAKRLRRLEEKGELVKE